MKMKFWFWSNKKHKIKTLKRKHLFFFIFSFYFHSKNEVYGHTSFLFLRDFTFQFCFYNMIVFLWCFSFFFSNVVVMLYGKLTSETKYYIRYTHTKKIVFVIDEWMRKHIIFIQFIDGKCLYEWNNNSLLLMIYCVFLRRKGEASQYEL